MTNAYGIRVRVLLDGSGARVSISKSLILPVYLSVRAKRRIRGSAGRPLPCRPLMTDSIWLWVGFNVFVLAMLALDLGVFHRKAHIVSFK